MKRVPVATLLCTATHISKPLTKQPSNQPTQPTNQPTNLTNEVQLNQSLFCYHGTTSNPEAVVELGVFLLDEGAVVQQGRPQGCHRPQTGNHNTAVDSSARLLLCLFASSCCLLLPSVSMSLSNSPALPCSQSCRCCIALFPD